MQVAVYGKNIEVTAALREYAQKKLNKLDRYLQEPADAQVTFSVERGRHIVEVTIPVRDGYLLRGEEATDDMYASIDLVVEKLEKQIHKYRSRFRRKGGPAQTGIPPAGQEEAEGDRIVRVKRFALKPQTVEEAVMQMNLLGHDFYVFTNAETGQVNVVYRRKDGNYGLIEPEQ
ncbi:MAG: ribosome-associated translation inhibitor RaiA [Bacillota bacterium]|nr:MAG: ribosome-associated translation inhibitor RaiA [Bacillota bacterium]